MTGARALEADDTQEEPTMSAPPGRPLRKDAARNRALLLEAAREVFAEHGLEASLDEVARRAGVGIGTAYRHFANKQELANALFTDSIDGIVAEAEAAAEMADPWEALVFFFESSARRQARDKGLHEVLMGYDIAHDKQNVLERLTPAVTSLFERARTAGVIRSDIEVTDSAAVFAMLGMAFAMCTETHPDLWQRYLTIMLDGLRATDRGPLPVRALTFSEVAIGMSAAKH